MATNSGILWYPFYIIAFLDIVSVYMASKRIAKIIPNNTFTEFLLYTTPAGKVKLEIFLRDETIWLTQAKIAELFSVDRSVVTKHLQHIFKEGELDKIQRVQKLHKFKWKDNER